MRAHSGPTLLLFRGGVRWITSQDCCTAQALLLCAALHARRTAKRVDYLLCVQVLRIRGFIGRVCGAVCNVSAAPCWVHWAAAKGLLGCLLSAGALFLCLGVVVLYCCDLLLYHKVCMCAAVAVHFWVVSCGGELGA
jgi:hypothetical protein